MEEYIRDFNTREILGIIQTDKNGDQIAIEFPSRIILGYYRAKENRTTDFIGTVLTKGNTVVSLIYKNKNKK